VFHPQGGDLLHKILSVPNFIRQFSMTEFSHRLINQSVDGSHDIKKLTARGLINKMDVQSSRKIFSEIPSSLANEGPSSSA